VAAGDVWAGVTPPAVLFDEAGAVALGLGSAAPVELAVSFGAAASLVADGDPGGAAAMEKDPEVASTLEMFPISTASSVYPDATGIAGRSTTVFPSDVLTGFATAKAPLSPGKFGGGTSSRLKVAGSPDAEVQDMLFALADFHPDGVSRLRV